MICATSGVSQWVPIVYVWHIKENMRRTLKTKSLLNQNLSIYYKIIRLVDNDNDQIYSS